jgi:hypothetical protein
MTSSHDLWWAAGLFDGEGCITIDHVRPYRKAGERTSKFRLKMRVGMTHEATVRRFSAIIGYGSICQRKRYKKNDADQWVWSVQGEKCYLVLNILMPLLFTKAEEAAIAVAFHEYNKTVSIPGRNGVSPEVFAKRHAYYQSIRDAKNAYKQYNADLVVAPKVLRQPRTPRNATMLVRS